ncbi:metallophosphoesterase [Bradyrhizobium sp. th.b2]|uniref:metallophosphoesterase family protein n=1 Tax=Bradyrhizobium sp. th-b2 TaxID=172088 RepID=UPI0018DEBA19|nr:metallophosphoesterase [Bradyrhizobium sp. th.b2]
MRIVVISDPHMHQKKPVGSSPSYLSAHPNFNVAKVNPIFDATELVCSLGKQIDWIICPGDISDQNDPISASIAWQQLDAMRKKIRARKLIGTVGNHDINSRRQDGKEKPEQALKALSPPFPLADRRLANKFWADDYVVVKDGAASATFVLVNSCALHGIGSGSESPSYEHGLISDRVIERLASELPGRISAINILIMHHHIRQHPWIPDDSSHAVNGPRLMEILRETGVQWLVVHGHQHLPHLAYGTSDSNSPVVLSAASIAAQRYEVRGRTPRNQMHLIEFDDDQAVRAKIFTWNWAQTIGWTESYPDSGLPRQCGFGRQTGLSDLCTAINHHVNNQPTKRSDWADLTSAISDLSFLVPDELVELIALLNNSGTEILYDKWQLPRVLDRGKQHT